ncbi:hypothetical protein BV20DRAFT_969260 [Pilatotrama ljubarskyi]|nr:hypothetical protein BV20DRAFT_969260 [Pilatotrama ljubarskyi]
MILAPAASPPPARSPGTETAKSVSALKESISHNIPPVPPPSLPPKTEDRPTGEHEQEGSAFMDRLNVPTVVLDTPSVSHTMAAALSLALLGHTLFLKSQVPLPVAQLARMPRGTSNPKAAKKREELLATFDILSSHLQTTFVALSTAYAKCKSARSKAAPDANPSDENSQKISQAGTSGAAQRGTAHLMFVVGPSVGAARARILLTIDGLDVKVWGERADAPSAHASEESEDDASVDIESTDEEDEDNTDEDEDEEEAEGSEHDSDDEDSERDSDVTTEEEDELDELDSDAECETDSAQGPPASRSPSPEPPTRSLAPSPESIPSPQTFFKVLPTARREAPLSSTSTSPSNRPAAPAAPPPASSASACASRRTSPAPAPAPTLTYAQEQAALRAAERLLSRTLMTAWADPSGAGADMASELAPTQTHVYLRAPRRFTHPAWVARQNLTRTLDDVLEAFLLDAGARGEQGRQDGRKKGRGVKTEGAWIGCRAGSAFAAAQARRAAVEAENGGGEEEDDELREGDSDDEEIWWSWEGKIVGFADW